MPRNCRKRPQTSGSPAASPGLFPGPLQVSYPPGKRRASGQLRRPHPSCSLLGRHQALLKQEELFVVNLQAELLYFLSFLLFRPLAFSSRKNPIWFLRFCRPKTRVISNSLLPLPLSLSIPVSLLLPTHPTPNLHSTNRSASKPQAACSGVTLS